MRAFKSSIRLRPTRYRIDALLGKIRPSFLGVGHRLHGVGIPVGQRRYNALKPLQLACFREGKADKGPAGVRVETKDLDHRNSIPPS